VNYLQLRLGKNCDEESADKARTVLSEIVREGRG
jgi:hypothetical protein